MNRLYYREDPVKAQKFCPVMTTDEIDPATSPSVVRDGLTIYLCCNTCVARFRRDPAAYLDVKLLPGLKDKKLPKREIEQIFCPVYKNWKVSARDPFAMYQGVKIYLFNDLAKERFLKDPARYIDEKILPQLPKK